MRHSINMYDLVGRRADLLGAMNCGRGAVVERGVSARKARRIKAREERLMARRINR